jgi:hypothetical protein
MCRAPLSALPLLLPAKPCSSAAQRCPIVWTRHAAHARRGRAAAGRCRPPRGAPPGPPAPPLFLLCRTPSAFKSRRPLSRFPTSPSLSFLFVPDAPSPPSSLLAKPPPLPSRHGPQRVSDRCHHRPPVRPANPPPFPDLEPPSPLSSSPTAPGASRSCRRPSLR